MCCSLRISISICMHVHCLIVNTHNLHELAAHLIRDSTIIKHSGFKWLHAYICCVAWHVGKFEGALIAPPYNAKWCTHCIIPVFFLSHSCCTEIIKWNTFICMLLNSNAMADSTFTEPHDQSCWLFEMYELIKHSFMSGKLSNGRLFHWW